MLTEMKANCNYISLLLLFDYLFSLGNRKSTMFLKSVCGTKSKFYQTVLKDSGPFPKLSEVIFLPKYIFLSEFANNFPFYFFKIREELLAHLPFDVYVT